MAINKIKLGQDFEANAFAYQRLIGEAKVILKKRLDKEPVDIFDIFHRLKEFDSFYKKIIKKNFQDDFFENVEDIAGVRVVCKYNSELNLIGKYIGEEFNIIREEKKITALGINEFGYLSDHYIVKLRKETTKKTEADLLNLKCEIQVRTLLMHSWASVSHDLNYKKEEGLDDDTKKELYAISGLLYIADQRFDSFKSISIKELPEKKVAEISSFNLQQAPTSEKLVEFLQWKFPERSIGKISDYIVFALELKDMNYSSIEQLDNMIKKASNILLEYEKKYPSDSKTKKGYDRIGSARICIGISDTQSKKSNNFYVIDLDEFRKKLEN